MLLEDSKTGFAPSDLTDGREVGEWKSRYPDDARRQIRAEAIYLGILLFVGPVLMALVCSERPAAWLGFEQINPENLTANPNATSSKTIVAFRPFARYVCAWLGGLLGGTVFSIKWLYHSVGKNIWNIDRRLWRLFTPHVSGALAFAFVLLCSSGIIAIINNQILNTYTAVIAIAFLAGYFSDMALAKFYEIAKTLFGPTKPDEEHHPKTTPPETH